MSDKSMGEFEARVEELREGRSILIEIDPAIAIAREADETVTALRRQVETLTAERDHAHRILRETSVFLAGAGVPGGTTIEGGVLWLRERAEKAEVERDALRRQVETLRTALGPDQGE